MASSPAHPGRSPTAGALSIQVGVTAIAGTSVTVTLPMNFQPSTFGGLKNVYVNAFDNYGLLTHWVQGATMTVQ